MISQVLTFGSEINFSLQVGDVVYYTPFSVTGGFNTVNNASTIVTLGIVTAIYNEGNVGLNIPNFSIVILYDNASVTLPSVNDYIMFAKNKQVNSSSLKGYYAEVMLENWASNKIELFSIGAEVSESSK